MYSFKEVYQFSKDLDVLYVEDDENLLEATSELLEDFFASVTTAVNGQDGLKKYKNYKKENNTYYDLIITDINMPKMNGLEMIKEIININLEQTTIVISAHNESERLIDLIHEGIANFVMKPIIPKQLMTSLYKTCRIIANQKQKDDYLIQQSKLASMGEMIDLIAHQWLQPIHVIKLQTSLLDFKNETKKLNPEKIKEYTNTLSSQVNHLIMTLQEFRGFFKDNSGLMLISYKELLESTLLLLKDKVKNRIDVVIDIKQDIEIKVIVNEFKHILINIINNAIDAFDENNIRGGKLIFDLDILDDFISLNITDNAGGVPKDIIANIFDSHFTTKEKGSGAGLYLSSMIIRKIKGKLKVENVKNGAKFSVLVKK